MTEAGALVRTLPSEWITAALNENFDEAMLPLVRTTILGRTTMRRRAVATCLTPAIKPRPDDNQGEVQ